MPTGTVAEVPTWLGGGLALGIGAVSEVRASPVVECLDSDGRLVLGRKLGQDAALPVAEATLPRISVATSKILPSRPGG